MTAGPAEWEDAVERAASWLRESQCCVVLTGAGVSAESGVPTFRDALSGLWAKFDPLQLATPQAFEKDPQLVSRWYDERRLKLLEVNPNPGHYVLADLERRFGARGAEWLLATQNVDRLHQRAGSRRLLELHGCLAEWSCTRCHQQTEEPAQPFKEHPPRCACGGPKRPAVVWFGEMLPEAALLESERASERCDLFFSIGTSAEVYPAAGLIHTALKHHARVVEINPQPTPLSDLVDLCIRGPSGVALAAIAERGPGGTAGTPA